MSKVFDVDIVRRVSARDPKAECLFYDGCYTYYSRNISLLRGVRSDVKDDIFHDSFLVIWTEIQNGKIFVQNDAVWRIRKNGKAAQMACSLYTFLLSIARYRHLKFMRDEGPAMFVDIDSPHFYYIKDEEEIVDHSEKERKMQTVDDMLHEMSERCKEILTMFYVKGYTLDKIMLLRKEKNVSKDGLKTGKSKCLAQLKKNVKMSLAYE